ncbi:hypothetical protein GA0070609_6353 [Micromonospora echinaurantiaca]|uniref:Uncharacterized protein n=1 Tax=Micromonospora echinaurantiaca TaxID=47857 RepID=A0A1C5KC05_9ACTN|nr:hypothetical protein GA0070609_6353 [Micromonospora echinaurantiaca]
MRGRVDMEWIKPGTRKGLAGRSVRPRQPPIETYLPPPARKATQASLIRSA